MNIAGLIKELNFKAIRSSGAGGQHVNKVSSKIELSFDIKNSNSLSFKEKELMYKKLANKLTKNQLLSGPGQAQYPPAARPVLQRTKATSAGTAVHAGTGL